MRRLSAVIDNDGLGRRTRKSNVRRLKTLYINQPAYVASPKLIYRVEHRSIFQDPIEYTIQSINTIVIRMGSQSSHLIQPNPIQSNPSMDPTHVQLCCPVRQCHSNTKKCKMLKPMPKPTRIGFLFIGQKVKGQSHYLIRV